MPVVRAVTVARVAPAVAVASAVFPAAPERQPEPMPAAVTVVAVASVATAVPVVPGRAVHRTPVQALATAVRAVMAVAPGTAESGAPRGLARVHQAKPVFGGTPVTVAPAGLVARAAWG